MMMITAAEVGEFTERVDHDPAMVIGHEADRARNDAGLPKGEPETLPNDLGRLAEGHDLHSPRGWP
jgi:hypothetical protein